MHAGEEDLIGDTSLEKPCQSQTKLHEEEEFQGNDLIDMSENFKQVISIPETIVAQNNELVPTKKKSKHDLKFLRVKQTIKLHEFH